jgi:hypothetical protein
MYNVVSNKRSKMGRYEWWITVNELTRGKNTPRWAISRVFLAQDPILRQPNVVILHKLTILCRISFCFALQEKPALKAP